MKKVNIARMLQFSLGLVVAATAFAGMSAPVRAQNTVQYQNGSNYHPANNYGGEHHQGSNNGGGRLDQYGQNHRSWMNNKVTGMPYAHPMYGYMYHNYRNTAHRHYYTYNGNEYYLNIDTGIRVQL